VGGKIAAMPSRARNDPSFISVLRAKVRYPLAVALGAPREVATLLSELNEGAATCYQLDLFQAGRLREELAGRQARAQVVTGADLWDLSAEFQTVVFPAAEKGERELKIDVVEQAFHILRPGGRFVVLSPHANDQLFPVHMKKVFRRVHATATEQGTFFWSQREGERPRRRHQVLFHARVDDGPSLCFVSRPGVFAYGRFDDGARALVESMRIDAGDRIIDIGCGCGTNGICAARRAGATGSVTFVDSNLRAVALAECNAQFNRLGTFQCVASADLQELPESSFDVALANPPYYAQASITHLFVTRARALLRPGGRLYLVTKQADQIGPLVAEYFGPAEVVERRGYVILCAERPA
jgi:16S rRNA G1207 methylase RsmC